MRTVELDGATRVSWFGGNGPGEFHHREWCAGLEPYVAGIYQESMVGDHMNFLDPKDVREWRNSSFGERWVTRKDEFLDGKPEGK